MSDIYTHQVKNAPPPLEPYSIARCRSILQHRISQHILGVEVDISTAKAILMVYDALSVENRHIFAKMKPEPMGKMAWKIVKLLEQE